MGATCLQAWAIYSRCIPLFINSSHALVGSSAVLQQCVYKDQYNWHKNGLMYCWSIYLTRPTHTTLPTAPIRRGLHYMLSIPLHALAVACPSIQRMVMTLATQRTNSQPTPGSQLAAVGPTARAPPPIGCTCPHCVPQSRHHFPPEGSPFREAEWAPRYTMCGVIRGVCATRG